VLAVLLVWPVVVGVAHYRQALTRTREAVLNTQLFRIRDAIDTFRREQGGYPHSLNALVEKKYLRKVPEDPFTRSASTWRVVPAEGAPGIRDVKSGSSARAIDGSRLSDW
jgi:general secretion pathway protein G